MVSSAGHCCASKTLKRSLGNTCSGDALTRTFLRALMRVRRAGMCTAARHSTGLAAIAWTEAIVESAAQQHASKSLSTLCQMNTKRDTNNSAT